MFVTVSSGTAGADGAKVTQALDAGDWWLPGFSTAYLAGAIACGVALAICVWPRGSRADDARS